MAKMVNVNRDVEDAFYRYKMPLLQAKVEGRGNGIKTAIPNMADVAKALDRPPAYPTKYLGVELGAQTQMYPKEERYIVNGAFQADRFQELLDGFIKKFVLCAQCSNPETVLRVTKKKEIEAACKACGYRGMIPMTHRLTTFIINNPPHEVVDKKKGLDKAERRKAKNAKAQGKEGTDDADGGDEEAAPTTIDVAAGSIRSNAAMREGALKIDVATVADEDDDDDWGDDVSEEAIRARANEQLGGASGFVATDDLEKSVGQRLGIFDTFVTARMHLPKFPSKEIVLEAERLDCKEKGCMVLVEHLLDVKDVKAALKVHQGLFQRFTFGNPKSQKYLMAAFEKLIEKRPELLSKTAVLFKEMYDLDLVEEEEFARWSSKVSDKNVPKDLAKKIHDKAKPFIEWLMEAEEEESSDDEAVAFESAAESAKKAKEAAPEAAPQADEMDDEEIDDI